MKIALLTIATTLLLSLGTVWSQPPGPEQRPGSQKPQMAIGYKAGIKTLPEIPGISLYQRLKLGNALCSYKEKEQSLLMKRYKITGDAPEDVLSAKDAKKVAKIDADLAKQRSKSQNKIRSILTQQQYDVFLEKAVP